MKRESRCYEHIGRAAEDSASRDAKKQIAHRLWWLIHADKFNTEEEAIESKLFTLPMQDVYERWAESILSLPRLEVRSGNQELPSLARVEVDGKPEVGRFYDRFYDGYLAG